MTPPKDLVGTLRRVGARGAFRTVATTAVRRAHGPVRRRRLRRRPLSVEPAELLRATGGVDPLEAVTRAIRTAQPSVERWLEDLEHDGSERSAELVLTAERICRHEFDLLGSGPVRLGDHIDWHRDFKSGARWAPAHISALSFNAGPGADIKVPWELSRFQHGPILAAAAAVTGDAGFAAELGTQLTDWIAANPPEFGPNWACTMDVAIRAANWLSSVGIVGRAGQDAPWADEVLGSLLLHARFIRSHLEWSAVRGNHYLADVVGLLCACAPFTRSHEGAAWRDWAINELEREMRHQVHEDGAAHEASLSYHRLVTEMFVIGLQAADGLAPGRLSSAFRDRLTRMLQFVADYGRPDGLAPQIGDADSGRFLPLGDYGTLDQRDHRHLFRQADTCVPQPSASTHPGAGVFVLRRDDLFLAIRCGDVGMGGIGPHAHNDQLSFELALGDQPVIVDPGTFVYTADPAQRNRFRSTSYHAALAVDGREQNPIDASRLFRLSDVTQAEALHWDPDGSLVFRGAHHGYERLQDPVSVARSIGVADDGSEVVIEDEVRSQRPHRLEWCLPLERQCRIECRGDAAEIRWPSGVGVIVTAEGCEFAADDEWLSPAYGTRTPTRFLRLRRVSKPGRDTQAIRLVLYAAP